MEMLVTQEKDVYVTCRTIGGYMRFSLRKSEGMYAGFEGEKAPYSMFGEFGQLPSRFAGLWVAPAPLREGLTLLFRIYTMWNAVTI